MMANGVLRRNRAGMIVLLAALAVSGAFALTLAARQAPYTVITPDNRRPLNVRTINGAEVAALEQLAPLFSLSLREDTLAGAMSITTSGRTIVLTPGQAAASIGGRVLSLSSPVIRDGRAWYVPLDFLPRVVAQATGQKIELRAVSRSILVGDIKWPQVAVRLERQGAGVRISADVQPAAPLHLTRDGNKVIARIEAAAIDFTLSGASATELVSSVRADGTSIVIDLGPAASIVRPNEDAANGHFTVDVAPAPRPGQEAPPADVRMSNAGLRQIAIDAGHGGEESGAKGDSVLEKDVALSIARKLKSAIESRLGARVIMTRDGDDTLPIDRRTSIVNNSQSDVLISIHADASFRASVAGAQVLTLAPADYQRRMPPSTTPAVTVPVAGGGTRTIDVVPWDLAQLPHVSASQAFAASIEQKLRERQVPMNPQPQNALPLRLLAGANMPAIVLETGFLSNGDDAAALAGNDRQNAIVEALMAALTELRDKMGRGGGL